MRTCTLQNPVLRFPESVLACRVVSYMQNPVYYVSRNLYWHTEHYPVCRILCIAFPGICTGMQGITLYAESCAKGLPYNNPVGDVNVVYVLRFRLLIHQKFLERLYTSSYKLSEIRVSTLYF